MSSVFDAHQRATIQVATARIIPTDRDPGAAEAGVIEYVERTLSGYARDALTIYREGVQELDRLAQEKFASETFLSLKSDEQDGVLNALERAKSPFFGTLLEHTMEGFYGDPRHGGNRNQAGWKMIGFPGPSFPNGYRPPLGSYDADEPDAFAPAKSEKP